MVQKWPFFQLFFKGNIGQENVFYDILERKNAFLGYKNNKFKKSKNWHFSKGLTHGFAQKLVILPTFFLGNIAQENVFYDILERKNAFLGKKNKKFKKSTNWNFSKGVNPWFCSKMGHFFQLFFLPNLGQENVFYDILERQKAIKTTSSKSGNIDIFAKGLTHGFA